MSQTSLCGFFGADEFIKTSNYNIHLVLKECVGRLESHAFDLKIFGFNQHDLDVANYHVRQACKCGKPGRFISINCPLGLVDGACVSRAAFGASTLSQLRYRGMRFCDGVLTLVQCDG